MINAQKGKHLLLIEPTALTDGATAAGNIDTKGANYATIRVIIGTEEGTDATPLTLSLSQGDTTAAATAATATVLANVSQANTDECIYVYHVDLKGKKRYLRLKVTAGTGTGSNVTLAADATLSRLEAAPENTSEMIGNTSVDGVSIA